MVGGYDSSYKTNCAGNDWLKPSSGAIWSLTLYPGTSGSAFFAYYTGAVSYASVSGENVVRPSLYLTSKVGIKEGVGTGEAEHPYILEVAG